jgi:hypothetical protein
MHVPRLAAGLLLVWLFLCSTPSVAQAALISVDYAASGDGLITRDTATGLDWLDLTETAGLSYSGVLSTSFVTMDGFRYATETEVGQLFTNAGGSPTATVVFTSGNFEPARLLLNLMGCTSFLFTAPCDGAGEDWSAAMLAGGIQAGIIDAQYVDDTGILTTNWASLPDQNVSLRADVGAFLVRSPTPVPEPASLSLLGLGLGVAGAAVRRRRKRAASN